MDRARVERAPSTPRTGRPMKAARKGQRYQIGVIVTGATKAIIAREAKNEGRTISRQVEHMIERCLQYDRVFKAMGKTAEEIQQDNLHAALLRAGFSVERLPVGDKTFMTYREPGHPHAGVSPGAVVTAIEQEQEPK
jgi:hypothetical protein